MLDTIRLVEQAETAERYAKAHQAEVETTRTISTHVLAAWHPDQQKIADLLAPTKAITAQQRALAADALHLAELTRPLRQWGEMIGAGRLATEFGLHSPAGPLERLSRGLQMHQSLEPLDRMARGLTAHEYFAELAAQAWEPLIAVAKAAAAHEVDLRAALGGLSLRELEALTSFVSRPYEDDVAEIALPANPPAGTSIEARREHLAGALVGRILAFFERTGRENSGLLAWIGLALTIAQCFQPPDFSPEDRRALESVARKVNELGELLEQPPSSMAQELEHLRRGNTTTVARLRDGPSRNSPMIGKLQQGAEVAVAQRQGRWLRVIYRDSLTDELETAWVYGAAVQVRAAPALE